MALWTMVTSAARTASGDSGAFTRPKAVTAFRAQLDVTAASGTTPTLDVVIEDSLDGTNWNTVGTFTQKTTTGRQVVNLELPVSNVLRARWTIGGTTPSFTFSVVAYLEP